MPRWLERPPGQLRVCLRPGMAGASDAWSVHRVRQVTRAVLGLDAELVAVVAPALRYAYREAFGRQVRFAGPQLLGPVPATCGGVVHEGGPDVTLTAAAHGVPQLVLADTRPSGDRLRRIGAGHRLGAAEAQDASDMTDALRLRRLAELPYGSRAVAAAQRLRSQIAALPSPVALVQPLEEIAAGTRRACPSYPHDYPQEGEGGV
jgi:UDP:flavonoid glycosyltransferase YjiC (YdhE family)